MFTLFRNKKAKGSNEKDKAKTVALKLAPIRPGPEESTESILKTLSKVGPMAREVLTPEFNEFVKTEIDKAYERYSIASTNQILKAAPTKIIDKVFDVCTSKIWEHVEALIVLLMDAQSTRAKDFQSTLELVEREFAKRLQQAMVDNSVKDFSDYIPTVIIEKGYNPGPIR